MIGHYVLGFAFRPTPQGLQVALIEKVKPDWMRGRLNGVGGKIEEPESPEEAMAREFHEETGYITNRHSWQKFTEMHFDGGNCIVVCFARMLPYEAHVRTTTAEKVEEFDVRDFSRDPRLLPNLLYLVPMARAALQDHDSCCPHMMKFLPKKL